MPDDPESRPFTPTLRDLTDAITTLAITQMELGVALQNALLLAPAETHELGSYKKAQELVERSYSSLTDLTGKFLGTTDAR